ncbi:integrase [Oceanicola sp. 22II-s10i]|nr:integrase [Oceanicola sp. 22II-s10i]
MNRSGRYHARLVVPRDLQQIVGKTELRKPLGGDYRQALRLLPGAVAELQHEIALAERKVAPATRAAQARYPLAPDQIAHSHYMQRLAFDDALRNDPRYASVGIDDVLVKRLREAVAGRATNEELVELVGGQLERFRALGNVDAAPGTDEWRVIARALCVAELEALARVAERDEGDFAGAATAPVIVEATPPEEPKKRVSLSRLWEDYKANRMEAGFMRTEGRRQNTVVDGLRKFVKHDDAARLTKKDITQWRDNLMKTLSAKTVSDVYLSTIRTLLGWAVENDLLTENVAAHVRQRKPRKQHAREQGYTDEEARKVIAASRAYQPHRDEKGRVREKPGMTAAKRWAPIICAFTGARITEITQLRKEDVREVDGRWVIRITPEAGSVKAGGFRDVPMHRQIVEEGFIEFVKVAPDGPLFHEEKNPDRFAAVATQISNRLATWLRVNGLCPEGLQPSHAWRHRFKTQCRELGVSDRVVDAIQGHTGKTAGDSYGDVTLKTKADAVKKLKFYEFSIRTLEP